MKTSLKNTMATQFQIWIVFTSLVSLVSCALPEKKGKTTNFDVLMLAYFTEHFLVSELLFFKLSTNV